MKTRKVTKKKNIQCLNSDISALPQNIIENILSLMPIQDALRTSILSKKWRYTWRSMPKLVVTDDMVELPSGHCCEQLEKYKLVNAIFHVLMLHNGPTILEFNCSVGDLDMVSEFDQIVSYLARGSSVKELIFGIDNYQLPISFFSLQGLERIHLENCVFEPPVTFEGFSLLKSVAFMNVEVSAKMLQRFLSKCPLLEYISLNGDEEGIRFAAGRNKFTFADLFRCAPLIQTLDISIDYMKYLCAGVMPHKLPTSLAHLKHLYLDVCFMKQNEISSVLCMIRSSLVLEKVIIRMDDDDDELRVRQTPTNFLDPENYPDLKLDHLEILVIQEFSNLHLEMEFVKLIMAKSPVLKKVRIELSNDVSDDEELKMYKDLVLLPIPRASPSAKLIIERL